MIVLDSSVALKWIFADEEGTEHAVLVRDDHVSGKNVIAVPTLFSMKSPTSLPPRSIST
jgi:hypothetical protein